MGEAGDQKAPTNDSEQHAVRGPTLLAQWANSHDSWCRAIAADVLKTRSQASDLDIQRYLALLLAEKKLSDNPFESLPPIEDKEFDTNPLDSVCLGSVKIVDGVNALRPGAEIVFAPGVTVIFGENGACIVLVLGVFFFAAYLFSPKYGVLSKFLRRRHLHEESLSRWKERTAVTPSVPDHSEEAP